MSPKNNHSSEEHSLPQTPPNSPESVNSVQDDDTVVPLEQNTQETHSNIPEQFDSYIDINELSGIGNEEMGIFSELFPNPMEFNMKRARFTDLHKEMNIYAAISRALNMGVSEIVDILQTSVLASKNLNLISSIIQPKMNSILNSDDIRLPHLVYMNTFDMKNEEREVMTSIKNFCILDH